MSGKHRKPARTTTAKTPPKGKKSRPATSEIRGEKDATPPRRWLPVAAWLAVVVVVAGIVALGIFGAKWQKEAVARAAIPNTVESDGGWSPRPLVKGLPTFTVWEDPQCPYCGLFEKNYGDTLRTLIEEKAVNVKYHLVSFLDQNGGANPDSSHRAVNALGCAIDQGVGSEFHKIMYANQPQEGTGWGDGQLISYGQSAGLSGAKYTTFAQCVAKGPYLKWSDKTTANFMAKGYKGTPTLTMNGKSLPLAVLEAMTPEQFVEYLKKGGKVKLPKPVSGQTSTPVQAGPVGTTSAPIKVVIGKDGKVQSATPVTASASPAASPSPTK